MTLAIFDLDETLIAEDSDHAWGEYVAENGLVNAAEHKRNNDKFYAQYKAGELDIDEYLRFACSVLAQHSLKDLYAHRARFITTCIEPLILNAARDLVEAHRTRGHNLMVITSTIEFVTRPIVDLFDISTLIAPMPELIDDRYTGAIVGVPSFGAGKVTRLMDWLGESDDTLEGAYFYSDSHNDLPLLRLVDNPVAVDPDPTLRQEAEEKAWSVISLR